MHRSNSFESEATKQTVQLNMKKLVNSVRANYLVVKSKSATLCEELVADWLD